MRIRFFSKRKNELAILFVAFATWFFLAYPASGSMTTMLWGPGGDALGDAVFFQSIAHEPGVFPKTISTLGAPMGYHIPWARLISQWPLTLFMLITSWVFNGIFAMNFLGALGFSLTAAISYGVCRRITSDKVAALAGPIVMTFQAGQLWNGVAAQGFTHLWLIALVIYAFIRTVERPSVRHDLVSGLSLYFCMVWNPYLFLLGGAIFAVQYPWLVFRRRKSDMLKWHTRSAIVVAAGPIAAATTAGLAVAVFGSLGIRNHDPAEVDLFSARALEYLLPGVGHPLHSALLWMDPRPQVGTNLYVGLACLLTCLLAMAYSRKDFLGTPTTVCIAVASTGIVFSQPRTWRLGTLRVPMPASLITNFTTTWRIFGRFGLLVLVAAGLLASIGIASLRAGGKRTLALALLAMLVLDLKSSPPRTYYQLAQSPALSCLRNLEPGVVLELPISDQNYEQWHRQTIHQKPLANGANPGDDWDKFLNGINVGVDYDFSILGRMGISFLVFDKSALANPVFDSAMKDIELQDSGCTDSRFWVARLVKQ